MSWFRRKTVENSPASDSLLFRIGDFRQITPEDRKLNRLWMYDREGNFLFRVIDEIGERSGKNILRNFTGSVRMNFPSNISATS